jgi:tetratricopeptide (TPR) repeat protein
MDRRTFLRHTLVALGGVVLMDEDWERLSTLADPAKVSPSLLDSMERINRHFAVQRQAVPPPLLRQGLVDHLDCLQELLGQSLPDDLQARLLAITSDAARRVAWNSYQLGDRQQAGACLQFAGSLAREAYCGERLAAALVYEADIARDIQPNPASALRLADAAVLAAGPNARPQITMAVRAARAEMHAAAGELFACLMDLHAAQEIHDARGPWTEGLIGPITKAELAAIRGSCELRLGQVAPALARQAVATLEDAFLEMAPSRVSWRATVQADLGAAYAQTGNPDQAAHTLIAALSLTQRDGAEHNVHRITDIRRRLLNVDIPAVRELDDCLR